MGTIKLILALFFLQQYVLTIQCKSQTKDTIYIIDFTINKGKDRPFYNEGTYVFFNTDSIKLFAGKKSTRIYIHNQKQINFSGLRIEGIRIIKEKKNPLVVRVKSEKRLFKEVFSLDTIVRFDSLIIEPLIYWARVRETPKFFAFFNPTHLALTNEDFVHKINYLRPKIRTAIMNSVKYEYYYPEGKLIRVKE